MTAVLYRKEALDSLAGPDRLDEMVRVTSPHGWAALGTALVIVTGCLGWSILGSYRTTVSGHGLLVPAEALSSASMLPRQDGSTAIASAVTR